MHGRISPDIVLGSILFTVPYFLREVVEVRSIAEFEGPPSLFLNAKAGEEYKMPVGWGAEGCFRSYTPALLLPSAPADGHFVLSPGFARIKQPRWRPLELNDRPLRLNGKIRDCEQSN